MRTITVLLTATLLSTPTSAQQPTNCPTMRHCIPHSSFRLHRTRRFGVEERSGTVPSGSGFR